MTYEIGDLLSNITIADSAVNRKHKIGSGNGERKIYLCGNADERINFFDDLRADIRGFVWRQNLLEYLEMAGNSIAADVYICSISQKEIVFMRKNGIIRTIKFDFDMTDKRHMALCRQLIIGNRFCFQISM